MKRISLVAALLGAIVLAFAGIAMAGGNGTTVNHYDVSYADPNFGPVQCIGVDQIKNNGAVKGNVQDSFTCTSTTSSPLTNLTAGQTLTLGNIPYGAWISDVNTKSATSFNGTVSADGMSFTAVATY